MRLMEQASTKVKRFNVTMSPATLAQIADLQRDFGSTVSGAIRLAIDKFHRDTAKARALMPAARRGAKGAGK